MGAWTFGEVGIHDKMELVLTGSMGGCILITWAMNTE